MSERIYIIVPRNLDVMRDGKMSKLSMTCGRAMGHASHAAGMLGLQGVDVFPLDLIVLSVADHSELVSVMNELTLNAVRFLAYEDEDRLYDGKAITAIVAFPAPKKLRCLEKYPAWRCKCNEALSSRSSVAEHLVSNQEVAAAQSGEVGSIPAGSPKIKEPQP
jgi:hypothetical protein